MSSNNCTNWAASCSIWPPRTVVTALENSANPAPTIFITPRLGVASSLIIRPSMNEDSRCGASRKSSADRLGGVSTTIRSNCPVAARVLSFSIAMYSWVPENEVEITL